VAGQAHHFSIFFMVRSLFFDMEIDVFDGKITMFVWWEKPFF